MQTRLEKPEGAVIADAYRVVASATFNFYPGGWEPGPHVREVVSEPVAAATSPKGATP
jgi:hypothetical protein